MRKILLLLVLAVSSISFSLPSVQFEQEKELFIQKINSIIHRLMLSIHKEQGYPGPADITLDEIKVMLEEKAENLNSAVINKVLTTLKCTNQLNIEHNNILTIIDYSLPSNEKRLWVFDLKEKKLLFYTYVSHGIRSGTLISNYFSNVNNSKASSIGVYKTEKTYYGRDGLSLRLDGLDRGFNDNASNRYVVMHGGWYVDENFVKKYGRTGRSWGCPAVPPNLTEPIINTIKDKSLFVIYYPNENWFVKSKFLNCHNLSATKNTSNVPPDIKLKAVENDYREPILFADLNKNNKHEENEPIVVMAADNYERIFHSRAPLERMLRRQINQMEYIALSNTEFKELLRTNGNTLNNQDGLSAVHFVIPVIKMNRGYYETHMTMVNLGKIKEIQLNDSGNQTDARNFTINFEARSNVYLKSTSHFIRWLGL